MATNADRALGDGLLILSASDVAVALTRPLAIESQRTAFLSISDGSSILSTAGYATDPATDALVFALTAKIERSTGLVGKVGVQLPANTERGLPNIHAALLVFDPDTGAPLACLNGNAITTLRTAAGLAVATDALAPIAANSLAVLGSGPHAVATVRMIAEVRELAHVLMWSPTQSALDRAVMTVASEYAFDVSAASTSHAAVATADIVATCTRSRQPVVHGEWLRPGQTVLTIGSYAPDRREIDVHATARATTFVDFLPKSRTLCGPLMEAVAAGILKEADVIELGAVLADPRLGRRSPADITIFHSLGIGAQDAAAGWTAYEQALLLGLSLRVTF